MTGAVTGRHHDDGGPGDAPAPGMGPGIGTVPAPVSRLICAVRTPTALRQIQRLVTDAELDQAVQLDAPASARMVRPYSWLLDRTGTDGIRLTDAGHLPPAEVSAAVGELGLSTGGPGRRESQVEPVRQLRESAQATGLLRKQSGQLLLTACGAGLRSDPAALWWYLAERMPLRTAGPGGFQPGLIMLVCVAAGATGTLNATIAGMLTAIGWMNTDGGALTGGQAAQAADGTRAVLGPARRAAGRPGSRRLPLAEPGGRGVRPGGAADLARGQLIAPGRRFGVGFPRMLRSPPPPRAPCPGPKAGAPGAAVTPAPFPGPRTRRPGPAPPLTGCIFRVIHLEMLPVGIGAPAGAPPRTADSAAPGSSPTLKIKCGKPAPVTGAAGGGGRLRGRGRRPTARGGARPPLWAAGHG